MPNSTNAHAGVTGSPLPKIGAVQTSETQFPNQTTLFNTMSSTNLDPQTNEAQPQHNGACQHSELLKPEGDSNVTPSHGFNAEYLKQMRGGVRDVPGQQKQKMSLEELSAGELLTQEAFLAASKEEALTSTVEDQSLTKLSEPNGPRPVLYVAVKEWFAQFEDDDVRNQAIAFARHAGVVWVDWDGDTWAGEFEEEKGLFIQVRYPGLDNCTERQCIVSQTGECYFFNLVIELCNRIDAMYFRFKKLYEFAFTDAALIANFKSKRP